MKSLHGKQAGAALLALIFVVVASASYLLVVKLNASTRPYLREQKSLTVLQEAKQALIAYALSYPELSGTLDPTAGPGYLPCPDTNNDGSPNPPCGSLAIGRFPGEWLGVTDYEDSSGERLWYALSGNFRNNPKLQPLNSDTPGQLVVDGITDIVAVIIAPGPPTETQSGRPSLTIGDYLEGENADGDNIFSRNSGGNDRLVYITRQELMQVIEKRVLGDVASILTSYQQDVGVYPWLTNFDPLATDYDPILNVREGYVAYNEINEVFPTQFSVSWDIRAGGDGLPFTMIPTAAMPDWNSFSPITVTQATPFSVTGSPECTWTMRDAINCNGRATDPELITLPPTTVWPWIRKGTASRVYDFTLNIPPGGIVSVPPGTSTVRTRDLAVNALFPVTFPGGTVLTIKITDTGQYDTQCFIFIPTWCFPLVPASPYTNTQTNTITTATDGDIFITDVTYDPGVGDEIPQWLIVNNWHKLTQAVYSAGDAPDNSGPCIPASVPACVTLDGTVAPMDNKRALVISAGVDLTANRPSANLMDYFEDKNASPGDDEFIKQAITNTFNDQVRVLQ